MAKTVDEKLKMLENVRAKFPDKADKVICAVNMIETSVFKNEEKRRFMSIDY